MKEKEDLIKTLNRLRLAEFKEVRWRIEKKLKKSHSLKSIYMILDEVQEYYENPR